MASIGFPLDLHYTTSLSESGFDQFVFVTAASSNHFHESIDGIALVQKHFPVHTLYFYDLFYFDLDNATATRLVEKVSSI